MSGGHFDYAQHRIEDIANTVEQLIQSNDNVAMDDCGSRKGRGYKSETVDEFIKGLILLRMAAIYAQRIDWLVSSDDDEESFHQRLAKDINDF